MNKELLQACRPSTGLYALLMTHISFRFYNESVSWFLHIVAPLAFAFVTSSIMVINDIADWQRDARQEKTFARDNMQKLKRFWWRLNAVTAGLVTGVAVASPWLGIFILAVWLLGVGYSYVPQWYILNNLIVAICSGSPALVGWVHHGEFSGEAAATFLMFTFLIMMNEVFKDVEDVEADRGLKATIPTRIGHIRTIFHLIGAASIIGLPFAFHPNQLVLLVGVPGIAAIAMSLAYTLYNPERIEWCLKSMRYTLQGLLLILLTTS